MNGEDIQIAARCCGPPNSGNGGDVCGLRVKGLAGTESVRLKVPLPGGTIHTAPWEPDASLATADGRVASEFIWAALDCPSAFALLPIPEGSAIVLGELCATVEGEIAVGETAVVSAWPIAQQGRRHIAGSALHAADGRRIALGKATWIEVPASSWAGDARGRA
jgi:hypothetical protein